MRFKVIAFTLMAGFATPAFSQDTVQPLRQALDHLPQIVGTNPAPMQAYFFDVQAWGHASSQKIPTTALTPLFFASSIEPLKELSFAAGDAWTQKSGIAFKDINYFVGFGEPPQTVSYWGLRDAQAAARLMDALKQREFVDVPGAVPGVLGNGNPKHKMDLKKADRLNPWRGPVGKVYFVKHLGNAIAQSPAPQAMAVLTKAKPSLAENVVVSAALDGLSATTGVDEGRIIQAAVISPAFGFSSFDPTKFLDHRPADAKRLIKREESKQNAGIPPYLGGILADIKQKDRPGMAVSLVYPDCGAADKAVKGIKARWAENRAEGLDADVTTQTVENAGTLCAAVVTLIGQETKNSANPVFAFIIGQYLRRDFNLLQIGVQR